MATMNVRDAAENSVPILLRGTVPLNAQHTFNKVVTLTDVVTAAGYAAGDAIGGLATFSATSIEDGRICIRSIRMAVNSANLGANNITCRVFGSAPPPRPTIRHGRSSIVSGFLLRSDDAISPTTLAANGFWSAALDTRTCFVVRLTATVASGTTTIGYIAG